MSTAAYPQQQSAVTSQTDVGIPQESSITVIIPTYNERQNITQIIDRCCSALAAYDLEILVVDDDSPDETWRVAQNAYLDDDRVHVIRRTEDRGLATAVSRGFSEANKDYCAVIDADLQHPPEKLTDLLKALDDGADIAIGSRHIDGGGIENWSKLRQIVSSGATTCAKIGVPAARGLTDPMSGFFAVRRKVVADVDLSPRGYKILLEVLAKGNYETVSEVPYTFRDRERGESKLTAREYQRFLEHCLSLGISNRGLAHIVRPNRAVKAAEFGLVGALGTVVNTVVFGLLHLMGGQHYLLAGTVAFLVAVNFNFLGNYSVTFDYPDVAFLDAYLKFHVVSVGGFVIYSVALAALIQLAAVPALIANVIAILGSAAFNFLGSENVAFEADNIDEQHFNHSTPITNGD